MSDYIPPEPAVIHRPGTPGNPFVLTAKGREILGAETLPAPAAPTPTVYEQRLALSSGADALRISAERAAAAGHRGFAASEEAHARILDALCEALLVSVARSEGET